MRQNGVQRLPNGQFKSKTPTNEVVKKTKTAADYLSEKQVFRMHEDISKFRSALDECENLTLFNRESYHRICREVYRDPHLRSQWTTRKLKTIEKEFNLVNANNEPNPEATRLFETQWFMDLMDEILESKMMGFRLIEIGPIVDMRPVAYRAANGRIYDPINVINPDHVKPEWGTITKDPGTPEGLFFDDETLFKNLIFVGKRHDFGIMMAAVKYVLFKNNCIENWSEWAEVFGMDIRLGKTTAEGDAKRKFLKTLKDLGSSGYGIIDEDDSVEFAGTSRTDAFKVYKELMETVDRNISKLIFGQDVVTNNTGRVVGEVGENVANLYGDSDAKFVARVVNDCVIPKLIALGLTPLTGLRLKWDTTEKLTMTEQADIDLKISQMGYKPAKKFLEEKYNIKLEELPEPAAPGVAGKPAPGKKTLKVAAALKELYADPVE